MKISEILPAGKISEQEAMHLFHRELIKHNYPAYSTMIQPMLAPGAAIDMAFVGQDSETIVAIIEFKRIRGVEKSRRIREAALQLKKYIRIISPKNVIRTFVVAYRDTDFPVKFEIIELIATKIGVVSKRQPEFPSWENLNTISSDAVSNISDEYISKEGVDLARNELDILFSFAKNDIEKILSEERSDGFKLPVDLIALLGEIDVQLKFRFGDLGIPKPWKGLEQLFASVAMFDAHLGEIESRLGDNYSGTAKGLLQRASKIIGHLRDGLALIFARPEISSIPSIAAWIDKGVDPIKVQSRPRDRIDLLIITAMHDPEYAAVMSIMHKNKVIVTPFPKANNALCYEGQLVIGSAVKVVAATQDDMGLTNAAVLATKLITHYRPRYVAMVGIAAGINSKNQTVGDIIYATHTYDLAMGKLEQEGTWSIFKPKIFQKDARDHFKYSPMMLAAVSDEDIFKKIKDSWDSANPKKILTAPPKLCVGSFGSGGSVIAHPEEVAKFKSVNNAIIGFDMEAHAVVTAVAESGVPEEVQVLILKSICDFAGSDKSKDKNHKQKLAAFTSSHFLLFFIEKYMLDPGTNKMV